MRTLWRLMTRFPEQSFLALFNLGVFTWLQTAGQTLLAQMGWSSQLLDVVPDWLCNLTGNSLSTIHNLVGSWPITWLVVTMIVTALIRFVKGVIKWLIIIAVVLLSLYMIGRYQSFIG